MGEILCKGKDALANLNNLLTNKFDNMVDGQARYSPMCNENGGCVDDLIVYKFAEDYYFVVVNAANRHKDFAFMKEHVLPGTEIEDISDTLAQLALQGPKAYDIISKLLPDECIPKKNYTAIEKVVINGMDCMISFTGYTGEAGYEIYTAAENGEKLWRTLREAGEEFGLIPCGLGARDTLRLEAAMPLYGHEMDDVISPLETGLNFAVKMNKENFIGKEALVNRGEPKITRVGLEVVDRGILREHQDIYAGDKKIGHTSSGTFAPYLKKAIAMALIEKDYAQEGTLMEVDVRGRRVEAKVVKLPFYKKSY